MLLCSTLISTSALQEPTMVYKEFYSPLLVLDLGLDIVDGIRWLWINIQSDGLASESLDKVMHATTQTKDRAKSRFILNVVIWMSMAILQLIVSEDETLMVRLRWSGRRMIGCHKREPPTVCRACGFSYIIIMLYLSPNLQRTALGKSIWCVNSYAQPISAENCFVLIWKSGGITVTSSLHFTHVLLFLWP